MLHLINDLNKHCEKIISHYDRIKNKNSKFLNYDPAIRLCIDLNITSYDEYVLLYNENISFKKIMPADPSKFSKNNFV